MFAFVSLAFSDVSSKKLLWPRSKKLLPVLSSGIFMVSYLTVRIYFYVWCKKVVQFHSSAYCRSVFPTPFVKETVFFSIGYSFLLCQRLVGHIVVGPFLGFLFCSTDLCLFLCQYLTVLMTAAL